MHIIKRELKANAKSLIIWSVVMFAFIAMMVSEFSAYYNNPEMTDILDAMPETLMKAFSMESGNLTTPSGFVSIASIYFFLVLGVFAILIGSNIISKEERDKTAEFFMTMPISREQVILSKWIAAIINCFAITMVTGISLVVTMLKYNIDGEFYKFLGLLLLAIFMTQMIFLSVGMLISSVIKRYKASGKISAAILMVLYFISIISALSSKLKNIKYLTPFKYFEPSKILFEGKYEMKFLVLTLLIITFCMVGTFLIYPKRDLHL